ncbi:MAG: DNA topoisomerase 4 subunit A [Actinobacteria bacterium]|uniref:DNA topoisomerase (ATP-hydrolyzing) n=1 Tax=freshwater metagenome TaxID=449393 RepID=A0A6J5Z401_9ZZZZ|nr:DNA topoisomerase 4 subunit A [Actinomycetota bacterium]
MTKKIDNRVVDIDVAAEMQGSFLEYAYSVIYSRALPDARDGLKPVQRRILHTMANMGLRPERGHVKCARVVGEVMGKLHPHGDSAIYDALVRMAQSWSLRIPFIDGHGNFGSVDEGPAAYRYTEARLAQAAHTMVDSLDEDVVDFNPNYDGRELEPAVLPAAIPNLLVNGASGIAVGMATNMAPHNLREVVAAAQYLLGHPKATVEDLMKFVPGPDLPTGAIIVGLEGVKEAYTVGKGSFRMRAKANIEQVSAKRQGIVITELPYQVGTERIIERIKELVTAKKLQGISDVTDLTDYEFGLRLVIEVKNGFNPSAVLEQLYKLTPLEEAFHINNVALVNGQPKTLNLKQLLEEFLKHRLDVVTRRSQFRLTKALDRLHLVDGLILAILDIDEVIAVIRSSDDAAVAKDRLMEVFELSDIQATYILDMPLRRLTKFSKLELEKEQDQLRKTIADLEDILGNEKRLRKVVTDELTEVAKLYGDDRRSVLESDDGIVTGALAIPLEVQDDPCIVIMSATGLLARTTSVELSAFGAKRISHDTINSVITTSARADIGLVTSQARVVRMSVVGLPELPNGSALGVSGGIPLKELVTLGKDERFVGVVALDNPAATVFLATANGVVKRVVHDVPSSAGDWNIMKLEEDDYIVGATQVHSDAGDVVLITSDAQLLRFSASAIRATGRSAAGMAGIKITQGARVIFGAVVKADSSCVVATVAGDRGALTGTAAHSLKLTPLIDFPSKGRATGGVRCHKFLSGENTLINATAGAGPIHACGSSGAAVEVPAAQGKRDGTGTKLTKPISYVCPAPVI